MNYDEYSECIYTEGLEQQIEEIVDKHIKNKIQSVIDEYNHAVEYLVNIRGEITAKENELKQLEEKLEYIKNDDKYNMPRMYINKFVTEYTGGYAPGDKVWVINYKHGYVTCDWCGGSGKLKINTGVGEKIISCNNCHGNGRVSVPKRVIEERIVERVDLKLCFEDRVNLWSTECVYCRSCDYPTESKYIFRTKEEAEQALKEMEG